MSISHSKAGPSPVPRSLVFELAILIIITTILILLLIIIINI